MSAFCVRPKTTKITIMQAESKLEQSWQVIMVFAAYTKAGFENCMVRFDRGLAQNKCNESLTPESLQSISWVLT
jgi:hypothetical protein